MSNVEDLEVVTTVVNTGDETLKLLKDPRGALSTWATNTFVVTNEQGATPDFTGAAVRYVPGQIASSTNADHFTVLAPGASVEVSHEGSRPVQICVVRSLANAAYGVQLGVATTSRRPRRASTTLSR